VFARGPMEPSIRPVQSLESPERVNEQRPYMSAIPNWPWPLKQRKRESLLAASPAFSDHMLRDKSARGRVKRECPKTTVLGPSPGRISRRFSNATNCDSARFH
jgi:hypothetical protein